MKLGAFVLTGDINKDVESEAPSGGSGDRRISPLEADFAMPAFFGPLLVLRHCGALAVTPTAACGQNVAELSFCPIHKTSGPLCATVHSMSSLRLLA